MTFCQLCLVKRNECKPAILSEISLFSQKNKVSQRNKIEKYENMSKLLTLACSLN